MGTDCAGNGCAMADCGGYALADGEREDGRPRKGNGAQIVGALNGTSGVVWRVYGEG